MLFLLRTGDEYVVNVGRDEIDTMNDLNYEPLKGAGCVPDTALKHTGLTTGLDT